MSKNVWLGGQARVSRSETNKNIVKKELLLNHLGNPQATARLKREIESLRLIDSPKIVKLLEYDSENFSWYTMPFFEYTLETFSTEFELEEEKVLSIANNILEAMMVIESNNMVHRDLKPSNILLNSIDDLVVSDFGLTKMQRDTVLTKTLQKMGTEYFSAPEQDTDARSVDIRADIYSFGRILTWLFTKENTFDVGHKLIPSKYRSLIRKCVEQSPDQRYSTISELKLALDRRASNGNIISRKKILEQITEDPGSYTNFLTISDSELNRFSEDELYTLIINGKLQIWLSEDFESFDKIYKLWEAKRDAEYLKRKYYPVTSADRIGTQFRNYILDNSMPYSVRTELFKKLIYHWGNRYYVMDIIFEIITDGKSDEEFITFLIDSLSMDDFEMMRLYYEQVGTKFNNISPYFLELLIL